MRKNLDENVGELPFNKNNHSNDNFQKPNIDKNNIWYGDNIKKLSKEELYESFLGLEYSDEDSIKKVIERENELDALDGDENSSRQRLLEIDKKNLLPDFDFKTFGENITKDDLLQEGNQYFSTIPEKHKNLLKRLLGAIKEIDFEAVLGLTDSDKKPSNKDLLVLVIDNLINTAIVNGWQICKNNYQIHLYNGAYWSVIDREPFEVFLGEAALKMGIQALAAKHYRYRNDLFLQFMATGYFSKPDTDNKRVLINLLNGTYEVTTTKQILRSFNPNDFLEYQLSFSFDETATAPIFMKFLDRVLPDKTAQMALSEFLGYLFINTAELKLEKALLLYGKGANGKSVVFDVIYNLLGRENVSSFSVYNLTGSNGYYRAAFAHKLLNYTSELSSKMNNDMFKQLTSGEPVEARLIYGHPFLLTNYGKFAFNANELPKDPEFTHGYFRRFFIIPFEQTIPEAEQDKDLAKKIIATELPGVLNWAIAGLQRLLVQRRFTHSEIVEGALKDYKKQSDNVSLFVEEEGYEKSIENFIPMKEFYSHYSSFCKDSGYKACSIKTFSERLKSLGFESARKSSGMIVYVSSPDSRSMGLSSGF